MKKIICPTDFSSTANNAIEYAAKLAQKLNAELEILNVQFIAALDPIVSGIILKENALQVSDTLKNICAEVTKTYNIPCTYSKETTNKSLQRAIEESSNENNLIVMGTNGTDDFYQFIFGSNTFHVIEKVKCPVLMVPEGVEYKSLDKIVFSWDYSKDNKVSFFQMKTLLKMFDPEIVFLHLADHKTPASDALFRGLKDDINAYLDNSEKISFDRVHLENIETITEKLDEYMTQSNANLLAVTYYDRGIIKNMFHGTVTKELSEIASYPMLVLHV